jgi:type IV secretion system protein VirB6
MGFFAEFNVWLTALLDDYVRQYTAQLAALLEPAVVTLGSLYVLIWGYLHLAGRIDQPFLEGLKRIAILAVVFGVSLDLWLYDTVIVETFFRAPAALAARLVGGHDFVTIIDTIIDRGDEVGSALLAKAGVLHGNFSFYFAALAVYLAVFVTAIYTMFLLTLSRVALSVLLAIGPLIIPFSLFSATRRFLEAWFALLAQYAFLAVLSGLVAALMLTLIDKSAAQAQAVAGGIQIAHALRVCLAAGFTFLVMRQVPSMAAGLASGVALSTFGIVSGTFTSLRKRALSGTKNFLRGAVIDRQGSRWDPMSRRTGYAVQRGVRRAVNAVRRNSIEHHSN